MGKIMQAARAAQGRREELYFGEEVDRTKRLVAQMIVMPAVKISEKEAKRFIKHYPYSYRAHGCAVVSIQDGDEELIFILQASKLKLFAQNKRGAYEWRVITSLADLALLTPASFSHFLDAA